MREEVRRLRWRRFLSIDDDDDYWSARYSLEIYRLVRDGHDLIGILTYFRNHPRWRHRKREIFRQ